MATIRVTNVPKKVYDDLRALAKRNGRKLNDELCAILFDEAVRIDPSLKPILQIKPKQNRTPKT